MSNLDQSNKRHSRDEELPRGSSRHRRTTTAPAPAPAPSKMYTRSGCKEHSAKEKTLTAAPAKSAQKKRAVAKSATKAASSNKKNLRQNRTRNLCLLRLPTIKKLRQIRTRKLRLLRLPTCSSGKISPESCDFQEKCIFRRLVRLVLPSVD